MESFISLAWESRKRKPAALGRCQGTSLRLATRPWLISTGEYGGSGPPGKPGVPAAVDELMKRSSRDVSHMPRTDREGLPLVKHLAASRVDEHLVFVRMAVGSFLLPLRLAVSSHILPGIPAPLGSHVEPAFNFSMTNVTARPGFCQAAEQVQMHGKRLGSYGGAMYRIHSRS